MTYQIKSAKFTLTPSSTENCKRFVLALKPTSQCPKQPMKLLKKHHNCFSTSEMDRGQTDLVQFEIDMGDV